MGRRIAILQHASERGQNTSGYAIQRMIPFWREDGHEVFTLFGPDEYRPADILFLHVDLSGVPEAYMELASRYPAAVNARVRDIRKSVFSEHLLGPGDDWTGPVIVKSNRNFGGLPEAQRGVPRLDGKGLNPPFRSPMEYRLFSRLQEVPPEVFEMPDLVVQRFLPEIEDDLFHTHSYFFLGSWGKCTRHASPNPIVKEETRCASYPAEVAPEILDLRQRMGFDYGKFDYVRHEGRVVLLDVNKTIGAGRFIARRDSAWYHANRRARAQGLYSLFPAST